MTFGVLPALGHGDYAYHGDDVAYNYDNHTTIHACDRERDGNRVRAKWYIHGVASTEYHGEWDPDGADGSSCGVNHLRVSAYKIRVCEEHVSCGAWNYHE